MHGGGRVGTMRKDAQAGVRDWEGPPALGGGWERRNWPARDSSLGLTQLKSQGEAGRLPQTQLLPFNTTPSPSGAPGKEWLGGQGGGCGTQNSNPVTIWIWLQKNIYISNVLKVEFEI